MNDSSAPPPRPWTVESSDPGPDLRIFRVRHDHLRNPRNDVRTSVTVLETPDWVNVVPLTDAGEVVMVEQWRFGPRAVTLEIPGGMIDPGEAPLPAGQRELREETGFAAREWESLGPSAPNPAFHDNLCHHYLARGATRSGAQEQDSGEDLRVRLIPLEQIPALVHDGTITHSLVLAALCRMMDLRPR